MERAAHVGMGHDGGRPGRDHRHASDCAEPHRSDVQSPGRAAGCTRGRDRLRFRGDLGSRPDQRRGSGSDPDDRGQLHGRGPRGGQDEAGWSALLEQRLPDIEVEVAANGDAGYVTTTGDEQTLSDLLAEVNVTDVDLVILFGSRFDAAGIADRVGVVAEGAITSIRDEAPMPPSSSLGPHGRTQHLRRASATTGTSSAPLQRLPRLPSSTL